MGDIIQLKDRAPWYGMTTKQIVGTQLRARREANGQTRIDVAALTGVAEAVVDAWESGEAQIPAGQLYRLAKHFRVPVASFFGIPT